MNDKKLTVRTTEELAKILKEKLPELKERLRKLEEAKNWKEQDTQREVT